MTDELDDQTRAAVEHAALNLDGGYYDQDGQPISLDEWGRRFEDFDGRVIAKDHLSGDMLLITVWLGYVEPDIESARLFGTALLTANGSPIRELATYDDKASALDGHAHHLANWEGR